MNTFRRQCAALLFQLLIAVQAHGQEAAGTAKTPDDVALKRYFERETARLRDDCIADIRTRADWESRRLEYRRQLQEMLGLWPEPPRAELKPVITGQIERDGIVVEKLHFQSLPGLYVTANLYRPSNVPRPLPTILYACGHAFMRTNGVSLGNKTGYQHHGDWFARHGYVCLLIDTVQLGEIEGLHHGTYREGMWWWNSRGYSPAGVEAWNCIRALDYLETRPEVDRTRFGMTGRSGGGSYTWTTAALDERIRVAAPVAGITDQWNHVVDGCIEGHCDCMFFVNTYRWDFPLNAALIAPRPLLIVNTDADSIFPLDGVVRTHSKVRGIYSLLGVPDHLGLVIGPGPHKDTQNLQVPVFRWFNQHLKGEDPLITDAAEKRFDPAELAVFPPRQLPADQRNTRIHESFVPLRTNSAPPMLEPLRTRLLSQCFRGWPTSPTGLGLTQVADSTHSGIRQREFQFQSQPEVPLSLWIAEPTQPPKQAEVRIELLDDIDGPAWSGILADLAGNRFLPTKPSADPLARARQHLSLALSDVQAGRQTLVVVSPRGVQPRNWSGTPQQQAHLRRRFMLLGQTLDGMRVWDIRQALAVARQVIEVRPKFEIAARRGMAVNALYASLFEEDIQRLDLQAVPQSHREGPDYLGVLKILDVQDAMAVARARGQIR